MATPTIASVTPSAGHTGGATLVEIKGTNFKLPVIGTNQNGVVQESDPTVRVLFGATPAVWVMVTGEDQIYCSSPIGDPETVDLTVSNLDSSGNVITGESVTRENAFTFQRPDPSVEGSIARTLRYFVRELKRQVITNVVISTHTDYDSSTGDMLSVTECAEIPAIILMNLETPESEERECAPLEVAISSSKFIERRPALVVDMVLTIVGVSDNALELLNLAEILRMFFRKNTTLRVPRSSDDDSNPIAGFVEYEMDFKIGGSLSVQFNGQAQNIANFTGQVVISNVRCEDMPGITTSKQSEIPSAYPHEATRSIGDIASDVQISSTRKE